MNGDTHTLTARVLRPEGLAPTERERWQEICARNATLQSPFLSWSYAHAVGSVHKGARLCVVRHNEHVVAFFPFQYPSWHHRMRGQAEPIGGAMTDAVGLICDEAFRIAPAELLRLAGIRCFAFTH